METAEYVTDAPVATSVHLAINLQKPLLIEGHAGVGKTEIAKVMARMLETNLIRLQCYEGLDASAALYEWNYQKQLLHIKLQRGVRRSARSRSRARDLLRGVPAAPPAAPGHHAGARRPVLLVDEVDRADEEFEAFMLEIFSDWQVTIPEIGTIKATHPPHVILTSNRTRELSRRAPPALPLPLDRLPELRQGDRGSSSARCRASTRGWPARSRASWSRCAACG